MEKQSQVKKLDTREMIALVSSGAVIVVALIYWGIQVGDVIELLEMAYG